ncbi:MAG: GIY-YIG nuclease family protein [Syntrophales bacterium]
MNEGYVYILSNYGRTTFYIGVTNDLHRRLEEHKNSVGSVFTSHYQCKDLLYFEHFDSIVDAIAREKQLKNWHREWKLNLILSLNPELKDLSDDIRC